MRPPRGLSQADAAGGIKAGPSGARALQSQKTARKRLTQAAVAAEPNSLAPSNDGRGRRKLRKLTAAAFQPAESPGIAAAAAELEDDFFDMPELLDADPLDPADNYLIDVDPLDPADELLGDISGQVCNREAEDSPVILKRRPRKAAIAAAAAVTAAAATEEEADPDESDQDEAAKEATAQGTAW